MKEYLKQEELKLRLKMIFNDSIDKYQFTNLYHMEIVLKYGLAGLSFEESLDYAKRHVVLSDEFAKAGQYPDDAQLFAIIMGR